MMPSCERRMVKDALYRESCTGSHAVSVRDCFQVCSGTYLVTRGPQSVHVHQNISRFSLLMSKRGLLMSKRGLLMSKRGMCTRHFRTLMLTVASPLFQEGTLSCAHALGAKKGGRHCPYRWAFACNRPAIRGLTFKR